MQKTIELPRARHSGLPHAMKIDPPTGQIRQVEVVNEGNAQMTAPGQPSQQVQGEHCSKCNSLSFGTFGAGNRNRCNECGHSWTRL